MTSYTQDSFFGDESDIPVDDSIAQTPADEGASVPSADEEEALRDSADETDDEPAADDEAEADDETDDSADELDVEPTAADESDEPADAPVAEQVDASAGDEPQPPAAEPATDFFGEPMSGGIPDPGQAAVDAFFGPPRLDRQRAERPPLVARWMWIAAACVVALALVGAGWFAFSSSGANISVPQLRGVDVGTATTRLAEQGLRLTISERRFSSSGAGTVLEQRPAPGAKVRRGDTVSVIVSAGSEQLSLPNVVGDGLMLARGLLEAKGLAVVVEPEPSQQPSDTVLASNPPAGTSVHTGDIIRLSVAASGTATSLLLPYDMTGVTVIIDPAPVNDALNDVPLGVARILRSLIEASHGVVVATRALADTSTLEAPSARAERAAAAATPTVSIGLSTVPSGQSGVVVFAPSAVLANATASSKLVSVITPDLVTEGAGTVQSATSTSDTVLGAVNAPWTRIQLGSFAVKADVARFSDPTWKDSVARGLYRALASLYGRKSAAP